jgi:hypothetical protein
MSWEIKLSPQAKSYLESIHWEDYALVAAATINYAETGEGEVERVPEERPGTLWLHVGLYVAMITLDRPAHVLCIWVVSKS